MAPRVIRLRGAADMGRALGAFGDLPGLAVLDSASGEPARYSWLAFEPLDPKGAAPRDLAQLGALLGSLAQAPGDRVPGPFGGGFVGALSYDLGVRGEDQALPVDPWSAPPVVGGLYTDFCVLDHGEDAAWLVLGVEPGDGRAPVGQREERLRAAWDRAETRTPGPVEPAGPLVRHTPSAEHQARIESVRAAIGRGDCYQANLAHRFTRAVHGAPLDLYQRLRGINPAPYMAYLGWDADGWARAGGSAGEPAGALLSAAPELLLECDGQALRTRPIKGTAARGHDEEQDFFAAEALLASAKDRAELAMIVDLERNDLGRVCRPGSVRAIGFPTLRSYATVHHLEADVVGELAEGLTALDALGALFPGGSITGAPKLASMELIADLEGHGRGFFTGSAGFLDARGHALWNILIRTLIWRPGEVSFSVGGGITYSSEAGAEDRETLHKGSALARALEAHA